MLDTSSSISLCIMVSAMRVISAGIYLMVVGLFHLVE
jgi:hypothetical protein